MRVEKISEKRWQVRARNGGRWNVILGTFKTRREAQERVDTLRDSK